MFYYPQREQAIHIQETLKTLYKGIGGEYYAGDDAWNFIKDYTTDDIFSTKEEYLSLINNVLVESKRILKNDGSIFLHCDRYASHYLREELDKVFTENNFQSEIIWTYKRWSNSKKGLLNAHQNIYF